MNRLLIVLVTILSVIMSSSDIYGQKSDSDLNKHEPVIASHRLTEKDVERLLVKPVCLKPILEEEVWSRIQDFPVSSEGITLSAELYMPIGEGK